MSHEQGKVVSIYQVITSGTEVDVVLPSQLPDKIYKVPKQPKIVLPYETQLSYTRAIQQIPECIPQTSIQEGVFVVQEPTARVTRNWIEQEYIMPSDKVLLSLITYTEFNTATKVIELEHQLLTTILSKGLIPRDPIFANLGVTKKDKHVLADLGHIALDPYEVEIESTDAPIEQTSIGYRQRMRRIGLSLYENRTYLKLICDLKGDSSVVGTYDDLFGTRGNEVGEEFFRSEKKKYVDHRITEEDASRSQFLQEATDIIDSRRKITLAKRFSDQLIELGEAFVTEHWRDCR